MNTPKRRKPAELASIRDALQPGACYIAQKGSYGLVLARTSGNDGVVIQTRHVNGTAVRTSTSELHATARDLKRFVPRADYDAALKLCDEQRALTGAPQRTESRIMRHERVLRDIVRTLRDSGHLAASVADEHIADLGGVGGF